MVGIHIVTRVHETLTYARARNGGRRRDRACVSVLVADGFKAYEPEQLVLEDRSARRGAKLLQSRRGDLPGEIIGRIGGGGVSPEGISRAVKGVCTRLDPNVYERAVPKTILRLGIRRGTEFLDGVDGHQGGCISAAVTGIQIT